LGHPIEGGFESLSILDATYSTPDFGTKGGLSLHFGGRL